MPGILALLTWMARPTTTFENGFREHGDLYTVNNPVYGRENPAALPLSRLNSVLSEAARIVSR